MTLRYGLIGCGGIGRLRAEGLRGSARSLSASTRTIAFPGTLENGAVYVYISGGYSHEAAVSRKSL